MGWPGRCRAALPGEPARWMSSQTASGMRTHSWQRPEKSRAGTRRWPAGKPRPTRNCRCASGLAAAAPAWLMGLLPPGHPANALAGGICTCPVCYWRFSRSCRQKPIDDFASGQGMKPVLGAQLFRSFSLVGRQQRENSSSSSSHCTCAPRAVPCSMRFESTAKVPAECMMKYHRISGCHVPTVLDERAASSQSFMLKPYLPGMPVGQLPHFLCSSEARHLACQMCYCRLACCPTQT